MNDWRRRLVVQTTMVTSEDQPWRPQQRSHGSKGYISLENEVIFQKVIGVAAVAAGLRKELVGGVVLGRWPAIRGVGGLRSTTKQRETGTTARRRRAVAQEYTKNLQERINRACRLVA